MIRQILIGQPVTGRVLAQDIIALCFALFIVAPITWMLTDNDPPWVRLSGTIAPTPAGGTIQAIWKTTPLKRDCPGQVQIEIISGPLIWPVLSRGVNPNLQVGQVDYIAPPWPLDSDVRPGLTIYRTTTFWYCNWLQRYLNLPIIQVGPDIEFETLPKRAEQKQ